MQTIKAVIFDLDGTLLNSLQDIALSMNDVLNELNIKTHKIEDYKNFVGDGALVLVKNALPKNSDEKLINKALKRFKEIYGSNKYEFSRPYDNILEMLHSLEKQNIKLAILSNKPHIFTKAYVKKYFSKILFQEVHGQKESIEKKPSAQGLQNILNALKINKEECLYVGDTKTDILTAKNAKVKSIGVLWGFRPKEELEKYHADYIVSQVHDILDIIKEING